LLCFYAKTSTDALDHISAFTGCLLFLFTILQMHLVEDPKNRTLVWKTVKTFHYISQQTL